MDFSISSWMSEWLITVDLGTEKVCPEWRVPGMRASSVGIGRDAWTDARQPIRHTSVCRVLGSDGVDIIVLVDGTGRVWKVT